jgi:hypothetical protein
MVDRKTDQPIEPRFDGFLTGRGGIGVPLVRNLSQEYRDHPAPEDTDREPPPAPRGFWARLIKRLRGVRQAG